MNQHCQACQPSVCPCDDSDLQSLCGWNQKARDLVALTKTNPPKASRVYAYLSVALEEALEEAPDELNEVAGAMLFFFFGETFAAEPPVLSSAGQEIVDGLIERANADGSGAIWTGTIPVGPGLWTGVNPLLPLWGKVKPWFMSSGSQFRAPAHPAFGSAKFLAALAEVRQISDTRTAKQLAIAKLWADGPGTATPAGHWNQIACEILIREEADASFAARLLSLLNRAMMDAGICCWDSKYFYWLLRPSQADPLITTPVGLPNFPSYTSGHSTFSAAAATVIGGLLPSTAEDVWDMAEEAALSRLYGGIHYRFDNESGLDGGALIGTLALVRDGQEHGCDCRRLR